MPLETESKRDVPGELAGSLSLLLIQVVLSPPIGSAPIGGVPHGASWSSQKHSIFAQS